MYETKRNITRTGTPSPTCHGIVAGRLQTRPSRPNGRCDRRGGKPVAKNLPNRRLASVGCQATSRPTAQTVAKATNGLSPSAVGWATAPGLSNRTVDTAADSPCNPPPVWRKLRPIWRLAPAERDGLELPETGKTGPPTQRSGHRALAKAGLATYKKKPTEPVAASFFLMKPALCCSRWFAAPGRHEHKHLCCIVGLDTTDFRLSRPSASRQFAIASVFTSTCRPVISAPRILNCLWQACCSISGVASFWLWTAGRCIDRLGVGCGGVLGLAWTLNGCRRMPRTSTLSRASGTIASMATWPTSCLRIWHNCNEPFGGRCAEFKLNNNFCDRSSVMHNSNYDSFNWLFKHQ